MSYREPIERKKRLWYVVLVYATAADARREAHYFKFGWYWALESHLAIEECIGDAGVHADAVWASSAVCAEDFVEREDKGSS